MRCVFLTLVFCLTASAYGEMRFEPQDEPISVFFRDFKDACNSNDIERVKLLSGKFCARLSKSMKRNEKIGDIVIVNISGGSGSNIVDVTTRTDIIKNNGSRCSQEVVYTLCRDNGGYVIEDIKVPHIERLNRQGKDMMASLRLLIESINKGNMMKAKEALSFSGVNDFNAELSLRGLSWIQTAVDDRIIIPMSGVGIHKDHDQFIGYGIKIADMSSGTNVQYKVMFKDGKIDRGVTVVDAELEFDKKFKEKQRRMWKDYEERVKKRGW